MRLELGGEGCGEWVGTRADERLGELFKTSHPVL